MKRLQSNYHSLHCIKKSHLHGNLFEVNIEPENLGQGIFISQSEDRGSATGQ